MYIHKKSYVLFRISYIFIRNLPGSEVIYIIQDVINTQEVIYMIQDVIYIHEKLYKVLGNNNTVSSLFYGGKGIFVI